MKPAVSSNPSALPPVPAWASLLWGFAEATAFFIVPDVLLGWACLAGVRSGLRSLFAILLGSVIGGALMYGVAVYRPDMAAAFVEHVPFVRSSMFADVAASYQQHGALGILYGPASGIPYKIYAVLAPQYFSAAIFLAMSIPARLERLALVWVVATLLGRLLPARWLARKSLVAAAYAALWIIVYAYYWSRG